MLGRPLGPARVVHEGMKQGFRENSSRTSPFCSRLLSAFASAFDWEAPFSWGWGLLRDCFCEWQSCFDTGALACRSCLSIQGPHPATMCRFCPPTCGVLVSLVPASCLCARGTLTLCHLLQASHSSYVTFLRAIVFVFPVHTTRHRGGIRERSLQPGVCLGRAPVCVCGMTYRPEVRQDGVCRLLLRLSDLRHCTAGWELCSRIHVRGRGSLGFWGGRPVVLLSCLLAQPFCWYVSAACMHIVVHCNAA